jgi:hypothetical protein
MAQPCPSARLAAAILAAAALGAGFRVMAASRADGPPPHEPPLAARGLGAFAFTNTSGTKLILVGESLGASPGAPALAQVSRPYLGLRTAFCSDGLSHRIAFERVQGADGRDEGRRSHYAFDHLEGLVFRIDDPGMLSEGSSCFLVARPLEQALAVVPVALPWERKFIPVDGRASRLATCDAGLAERIAAARSRAVTHCWPLRSANHPRVPHVVLIEFARRGNDALASVVVVDRGRLTFADQPGDYGREGGLSVWRVGDGGKLDPASFDVLLLARRGRKAVLALSWVGREATVLKLMESRGGQFRELLRDSWYQASF